MSDGRQSTPCKEGEEGSVGPLHFKCSEIYSDTIVKLITVSQYFDTIKHFPIYIYLSPRTKGPAAVMRPQGIRARGEGAAGRVRARHASHPLNWRHTLP